MTDQDILLLTIEACPSDKLRAAGLDALDRVKFQMRQLQADSIQRHDLAGRLDWYINHCARLESALGGTRDMLKEAAKQFRATDQPGHAEMCERHANTASQTLADYWKD